MKEFKEQLEKDHLDEIAMYKKMANDLRTKLEQFQKEIDEKQVLHFTSELHFHFHLLAFASIAPRQTR